MLITTDLLYADYLHGIADIKEDVGLSPETIANWNLLRDQSVFRDGFSVRETRTSLTYRDVLKVVKLGGNKGVGGLLGIGRR
jgi:alkylated DNA repair protein alkB homolog 6